MKYDIGKERELLELLEKEDEGNGVAFSDHKFIQKHSFSNREEFLNMHDLNDSVRYHFDRMVKRGYVNGGRATDTSIDYSLTSDGHDRLDWHRGQDLVPRTTRFLRTTLGVVLTSILLPVFVSVLTVLALGKLGISK